MARTKKATSETPKTTAQSLASLLKSSRDIMRKDKGLSGDLDRLPLLTWIMFLKFLDDLEMQREVEAKLAGTKFRPAIEKPYRWRDWAANPQGITGEELLAFINQDECVRPDGKRGPGLFAYLRKLTNANGDDRRDVIATVFKGVDNRMRSGYLLRDIINKVADIHFTSSDELLTLGSLYESMLREMRDAAGDSGEFYTPRPVVRFMVEVTDPQLGETVLDPASGTGGFLVESYNHLAKQVKTVGDRKVLQGRSLFGCEAKPLPYLLCQMNLLLHGLDSPQIDPLNALRFKLTEIGEKDRVDVIVTNPPFGGEEEKGIQGNFPEDRQTSETALLFLQLIMRKLRRQPGKTGRPARAAVVVPESVMSDPGVAQRVRKDLIENHNLHTIVRLPKGVFEPYSDIQTNLLFFDTSKQTDGIWFYQHEVPESRRDMKNPCYTRSFPLTYEELEPLIKWWRDKQENSFAWHVSLAKIKERDYTFDFRNPLRSNNGNAIRLDKSVAGYIDQISEAKNLLDNLEKTLASIYLPADSGQEMSLGSFLKRVKKEVDIVADTKYDQITVKLYGKGVIRRTRISGVDVKTRPQFRANVGNLIISKIDARNGAFGIVPPDLDGAIITNDFPVFEVNTEIVHPRYLALLLMSDKFVDACKRSSKGTTNRKRLKEDLFLAEKLPIAGDDVQKLAIVAAEEIKKLWNVIHMLPDSVHELLPRLADTLISEDRVRKA